ncbi:MAG: HD domain-containing protein [Flavisolibacter sp.]|nr:HD domain-containing protein [Flavisolibacter sp.]
MHDFEKIKRHVLKKLEKGLPSYLTYHNISHTLDVLKQSLIIAREEGIDDPEAIFLLKVGSIYHDTGFEFVYSGHEEKGCEIVQRELPNFHFSSAQIESICGLIMATKIPQSPKNYLEEIICDADLDYLGRSDFYPIGEGLYKEFLYQGIVSDEKSWNELQVRFLESHHYFTKTCKRKREATKQRHLDEIKASLKLVS